MPEAHTLDDLFLTLNSVDLAPWQTECRVRIVSSDPDDIATVDGGTLVAGGGLVTRTLQVGFVQSFEASAVYATLYPLIGTDTAFALRPTTAVVGATNPSFTGTVRVSSMSIVDAEARGVSRFSNTWKIVTWNAPATA